jgi:hypothetical protein
MAQVWDAVPGHPLTLVRDRATNLLASNDEIEN